jgi:hypothetical protein
MWLKPCHFVGITMTEVKSEGGTKQKAPCGTWISPISAESVAQGALKLSQPMYGADGITL